MVLTLSNKIGYSHCQWRYLINADNSVSDGSLEKNKSTNFNKYLHSATSDNGLFFSRVKQTCTNGYIPFTGMKSMQLKRSTLPEFSIYPNPFAGIGIKFDDIHSGKILVFIKNTQGQSLEKKEFEVFGLSSTSSNVTKRIYGLRLTDVTSHLSCVNRLFIK